jgi:major membrane immunogen (membrane-anchored lipoprotein)
MRNSILPVLGVAVFVAVLGTKSVAQTGALPPGDYQQTCRSIRDNGSQLNAQCQNRNGQWQNTSLDYRSCQGSIVNDNGQLRCASSRSQAGGQQAGIVPQGSYQETCRNARTNGPQLLANCQKKDGSWQNTSIDTRSCKGNIVNEDGNLRCQ